MTSVIRVHAHREVMGVVKSRMAWWRYPDHFDWLSEYFDRRALQPFVSRMMAAVVIGLAVTCTAMMFSPAGPRGLFGWVVVASIDACCVVMASLWWRRWPSRGQSIAFTMLAAGCMSAASLIQTDALAAMTGVGTFAMLNGYAALGHSARVLAMTSAIGLTTVAWLGVRVVESGGDVVLAVTKVALNAMLLLLLPLAVQMVVNRLGRDVLALDIDPLSGLLNRRGLSRSCRHLARGPATDGSARTLVVTVIDLDDFKSLNDQRGHAVGDEALVAISALIREHSPDGTLVARTGGEEFLIVTASEFDEALAAAEDIRREVARLPYRLTASLGIAQSEEVAALGDETCRQVDQLTVAADTAMYAAKRAGGDRVFVAD